MKPSKVIITLIITIIFTSFLCGCTNKHSSISGVKLKAKVGNKTYYAPLVVEEVNKMKKSPGYDLGYKYRYNNNYWAQYDWKVGDGENDSGDSSATVESYAKARGLRIPTKKELLALYKAYPDSEIQKEFGWPAASYWSSSKDKDGNHYKVGLNNGDVSAYVDENFDHIDHCVILVK